MPPDFPYIVKPIPDAPIVSYDVAALQVKVVSMIAVIDDLRKGLDEQAVLIASLQERLAWVEKGSIYK